MSLTDDDLEAAILFPAVATAMIEIVKRCHAPMGQFARLERERFLQQERANKEAIGRCNAEERLTEAEILLMESPVECTCGDKTCYACRIDAFLAKGKA